MNEIYYAYNNEAIASCVILQVLQDVKTIQIARSCLLLPFLFDDRTVGYLQGTTVQMSLEQFIKANPRLFSSFNKRYLALLPVTINAVVILSKADQIAFTPDISLNNNLLNDSGEMGERFNRMRKAVPFLLEMFEPHTTAQLYKLLKIQL